MNLLRYSVKQVKFRNYKPHTEDLKEGGDAPPLSKEEEEEEEEVDGMDPVSQVESQISNALAKAAEESEVVNIAPKKPNWDLHRDVESRLNKLNKLTQLAIIKMNSKCSTVILATMCARFLSTQSHIFTDSFVCVPMQKLKLRPRNMTRKRTEKRSNTTLLNVDYCIYYDLRC